MKTLQKPYVYHDHMSVKDFVSENYGRAHGYIQVLAAWGAECRFKPQSVATTVFLFRKEKRIEAPPPEPSSRTMREYRRQLHTLKDELDKLKHEYSDLKESTLRMGHLVERVLDRLS